MEQSSPLIICLRNCSYVNVFVRLHQGPSTRTASYVGLYQSAAGLASYSFLKNKWRREWWQEGAAGVTQGTLCGPRHCARQGTDCCSSHSVLVCVWTCVCFHSALAGWHLYSVNNSSVRPALIRVSHQSPRTLTLLISPYLLYVSLSLSLPQQPVITLEGSVSCTFPREGISTVTVQVSVGNSILQDRKSIAVHGEATLWLCCSVNSQIHVSR